MVIMFRGTKESKNYAPQVLSLYAGMNALKYGRKTLVLQLMREFPVEDILAGKVNRASEINGVGYRYENNNIDSLIRQAGMREVEKEQFDLCGMQMLTEKDKLNVIRVSSKLEFEKDLLSQTEDVGKIIEAASKEFDDIYILGNGKNGDMMEKINPMVDLSVICIPQGNMEEIPEMITFEETKEEVKEDDEDYEYGERDASKPKKKKQKAKPLNNILLMITNYDKGSAFSPDRISKAYNVKQGRIALFPYNVAFKDAYNTDSVLQFAMKNTKVYRGDDNFDLMRCVFDVMKKMMGNNFPESEEIAFPQIKQRIEEAKEEEKRILEKINIVYTKQYSGPFGIFKKEGYDVILDEEAVRLMKEYQEEAEADLESPGTEEIAAPEESRRKKKKAKNGFLANLFSRKKKEKETLSPVGVTASLTSNIAANENGSVDGSDLKETDEMEYEETDDYMTDGEIEASDEDDEYEYEYVKVDAETGEVIEDEDGDIMPEEEVSYDSVDDFVDDSILGYDPEDEHTGGYEEYEEPEGAREKATVSLKKKASETQTGKRRAV